MTFVDIDLKLNELLPIEIERDANIFAVAFLNVLKNRI